MKTSNFLKVKSLSLLTVSALTALSLVACGKKMDFDKIADPGSLSNPPADPPGNVSSKVENFSQGLSGKVDILFIVDNSASMKAEQTKLGEKLNAFLAGLDNVDWQIAFTTTDVSGGTHGLKGSIMDLAGHPGQKILTNAYSDAQTVFLKTVQRSETGSGDEQALKASILAMQKHDSANAGFFRADANLSIVILSDEDEMSTGSSNNATTPSDVVESFKSIFGSTKKLSAYGIIIETSDVACYNSQDPDGSYGTFVTGFARITSGITGSICDADYSQTLVDIGNDVRLLSDYFVLAETPVAGSVKVKLTPAQNIKWKVEKNRLTFEKAPKEGSSIEVTYNHED